MKERKTYTGKWFQDFWNIMTYELRHIFSDSGVVLIFFVAGLAYPILYNILYMKGMAIETPVAVVDDDASSFSRQYIRELDATKEVHVAYKCINMAEAEKLMQTRKVKGIFYFPRDFSANVAKMVPTTVSVYADMSSFLYYKNALTAANGVMLKEIGGIQAKRYSALGMTAQETSQLIQPVKYEFTNPYNRAFAYNYFLVTAILLIIVQQTMFYGMSLLAGTMREKNASLASLPEGMSRRGIGRVVIGRGAAYWLVYMAVGLYIVFIVPAIFGFPQRGNFWDIVLMMIFFVADCVLFSLTWSTLIKRRETVFVLFLAVSPLCLFLTGTSWPTIAFPKFWKLVSVIFPSTFGVQALMNMEIAGGDMATAHSQMVAIIIQMMSYYFLASIAAYVENWVIQHKEEIEAAKMLLAERTGRDLEKEARIIGGQMSVDEYRKENETYDDAKERLRYEYLRLLAERAERRRKREESESGK